MQQILAGAGSLHETAGEGGGATDLPGARWNAMGRAQIPQNGTTGTTEMLQYRSLLIKSNFARRLASN